MPDREAIIEAMAEAMWHAYNEREYGDRSSWGHPSRSAKWRAHAAAAYDASPIARYRKALEEIQNELGVPRDGYPAPVANAHAIAERALRGDD